MPKLVDPLGVFKDGRLVAEAPTDLVEAYAFRDQLAAEHGVDRAEYEVLMPCRNHPDVSGVDCLDCTPLSGLCVSPWADDLCDHN